MLSSVTKKYIMALTGLGLFGFAVSHLAGNLKLIKPDGGTDFNRYAEFLESLGGLLIALEAGLVLMFLVHVVTAISLKRNHKAARPQAYAVMKSKGGPSLANPASKTMIFSGLFILGFLIFHIWQFKFGPGINEGYTTVIDGKESRDLYTLVAESFRQGWVVLIYCIAMIILGFHLRHGLWSLFQSLGVMRASHSKIFYCLSFVIAAVLALGFFIIPVWMFFDFGSMLGLGGM